MPNLRKGEVRGRRRFRRRIGREYFTEEPGTNCYHVTGPWPLETTGG